MSERIASAVFDTRDEADCALIELRANGVPEESISVIGRHGEQSDISEGIDDRPDRANASGAVKGAIGGGIAGGLLGLAALAIPGVGPLAAAGAIAASAVPEGVAIGAGIGALTGGLIGLLTRHGVDEEDAKYYEQHITNGGYFVSVEGESGVPLETAREILFRNGGHSASHQQRSEMPMPAGERA